MIEKQGSSCAIAMLAAFLLAAGCRATQPESVLSVLTAEELSRAAMPSNHRNWVPAQAVLPYSERQGRQLTVHNVRNCLHLGPEDYIVRHDDRTYDLDRLEGIDFIVVPFKDAPSLAHTMLSFDFRDQGSLACSVEVRLEDGETYSPVKGALRQYELMYVLADERDVIGLRAKHREDKVYVYATRATPEQSRAILLDVMARVNKLSVEPEFYDTFTNNCTTNLVTHINRVAPGRIPANLGVVLPGYADQWAFELGLLQPRGSFAETRKRAEVSGLASRYVESPDFSDRIRRR